jgi:nucleotide-binding universal stress UspA family protein
MTTFRQGSTFEIKRILCPVDLSDFSPPVLAHAAALARLYGAEITALHVFAAWLPPPGQATYPGWMIQIPEARESITQELTTLVDPFATNGHALSLRTADGDAATEIVRHAQDLGADLIVMGTHGRSGFDRFTLGSVTEKVLRKASCPVLTLPPGAARVVEAVEYRHILWTTDFSEPSERALELAVSMAVRAKGVVLGLHVVETLGGDPLPSDSPEYVTTFRRYQCDSAKGALHELVDQHRTAGCRIDEAVVVGKPYQEILRMAADRNVDVIVIGVRGRGSVDLTLFGSTTNHVVRRAMCPVMTLRGH